jgi:CO/xanthine dehydrogenase Mo-binding subunit
MGQEAGLFSSCSFIKVNEDGTVGVLTGAVDIGQGSNTALSQIVAEELGVRTEDVTLITGDTDTTPFDWGTVASRVTYNMGNAVKMAATDAKRQLLQRGAAYFEEDVNNIEIKGGKVFVKDNPSKSITIMELSIAAHWFGGGPILGKGVFFGMGDSYDIKGMKGFALPPVPAFIFGTQIIEVETDPESGVTNVLRVISCHDAGKVINPIGVEGQVDGGVSQGLGYGLSEEIRFDRGKVLTTSFRDYRLLTAPDMPEIDTLIIEEPEETGPFGAKGIAEPPLILPAPALANAIYDAVGVRIKELPLAPEKVFQELKQKQRILST